MRRGFGSCSRRVQTETGGHCRCSAPSSCSDWSSGGGARRMAANSGQFQSLAPGTASARVRSRGRGLVVGFAHPAGRRCSRFLPRSPQPAKVTVERAPPSRITSGLTSTPRRWSTARDDTATGDAADPHRYSGGGRGLRIAGIPPPGSGRRRGTGCRAQRSWPFTSRVESASWSGLRTPALATPRLMM